MDSKINAQSLVLDISICCNFIWSCNIYRLYYILIVVLFAELCYAANGRTYIGKKGKDPKDNIAIFRLVGQSIVTEAGEQVIKCKYRYDMVNKVITTNYRYPCPAQIYDKVNR